MKKAGMIILYVTLFFVLVLIFNLSARFAKYESLPPLATGPQLKASNEMISNNCTAMAAPSFYKYQGWPFPSMKPRTDCDPTRLLWPVGMALNTLLAASATIGIATLIKGSRRKSDDEPDERPIVLDEA